MKQESKKSLSTDLEIENLRRENTALRNLIKTLPTSDNNLSEGSESPMFEYIEKQKLLIHINDFARFITAIPFNDDLFSLIVHKLREITGSKVVTIALYDKTAKEIVVREIAASKNDVGTFEKTVGKHLKGMRFQISDGLYRNLIDNPAMESESINDLMFGSFPKALSKVVEKLFSIDRVLGLVLLHEGEILGTLALAGSKKSSIYSAQDLQGFVGITTIAVQRYLSEKQRLQDEQKYGIITDNSSDLIWILGLDLKYQYISPAVQIIRGYSVEETLKMSIEDILTPESYTRVLDLFNDELKLEKNSEFDPNRSVLIEIEEYHKNGSVIWIESKMSFLRDEHLNPKAILGISRDITQRKQDEKKIARQNAIINSLFINLPFDFWIRDNAEKLIICNKLSEERWGYKIGSTPVESTEISPEVLAKWENNNKRVLSGEIIREEIKLGDNTYYQIISPFYEDGNINGFGGINIDISDRKQMEDQIRFRENDLQITLNSIGDAVISTDSSGRIVRMNPVAEEMTGWKLEEASGRSLNEVFNIIHADTRIAVENPVLTVLRDGKVIGLANHTILISKDGTERQIADSAAPIKDLDGSIRGVVLVFSDVTQDYAIRKEIRQSEARLRQSEKLAGFGYWDIKIDNNEVIASGGARDIFGFGDSDLNIDSVIELVLPKYKQLIEDIIFRAESTGKPPEVEFRIRRKVDNEIRVIRTSVFYNMDSNVISGVLQDITVTKKAQEALEFSEARYKQIVEKLTLAVIILQNNKIVFANQAAQRMIGTDDESQLLGMNFIDFIYPDDRAFVVQLVQTVQYTNLSEIATSTGVIEERLVRFDDSIITVEASAIIIDYQEKPAFMVWLNDITKKKEIDLALQKSEEKFRSLAEGIQDIIIRYDKDYTIQYINPAGLFFFNLEKVEYFGKTHSELNMFDFSYHVFWESQIGNVISTGLPQRIQLELDFNSEYSYLDWYISPETDNDGNVLSVMCISRDITEMRLILDELEKAKRKAEESDRLKSAFLANMSHEIRTPMNGIIGFAGLLTHEDLSTEERIEFSTVLGKSARRLMDLVNNIIDLSKIETQQMEISISPFNLNKALMETYEQVSNEAEIKGLQLEVHYGLENVSSVIESDEMKIIQILKCILNNALKFTSSGRIDFGYKPEGNDLHFFVKDTGIGISEEFIDKIFDRFSQEDNSFNRNYEGSGLGLCIAKGLIEILGGNIGVDSRKDLGSNFYFTLHNVLTSKVDRIIETFEHKPEGELLSSNKKVIIAEDDNISYVLLNNLIRKATDYEVLYATNGEEAVKLAQETEDLYCIFMDIKMPIMDGLTATRLIRRIHPELPIIAVTALAMIGDHEKALIAGCTDYLSKPFNPKEVIALLKKYA